MSGVKHNPTDDVYTGIPVAEHAQRKPLSTWLLLASLYMTQFMGVSFFMIALVVIMRRQGMPLEQLGGIYLLGMFWVVKFLWAPLVDRFGIKRMGHYRGWLLLTQTGMVLSLVVISFLDIATQFGTVLAGCMVLAFFSSTQDIAADGLACRLLSRKERGLGSGIQFAGGMVGNILGGGVVLMAYPHIGWKGSMLVMASCTLVCWVQVLCFRETTCKTDTLNTSLSLKRLLTFWKVPGHGKWLLLLLVYPAGCGIAYAISAPMMLDLGWSMEHIGLVLNILGSAVAALSSLCTSRLLRWRSRSSVLITVAAAQVIALPMLALPLVGPRGAWTMCCAVMAPFIVHGAFITLMSTMMMDRAAKSSPATDFTLQFSVYSLVRIATASGAVALAGLAGYLAVVLMAWLVACLALLLSLCFNPSLTEGNKKAVTPVFMQDKLQETARGM
ncbi:MFS transporter [Desulfogranum japonicum]|uniref:MFS transporter n=1 Tax=Desulfogranum japonicum TaxID=231447 RepID=UPI000405C637|nr:MFS transporter [Desulfogranum japonicum]